MRLSLLLITAFSAISLGTAQTRIAHPIDLSRLTVVQADAVARMDAQGHRVGPWIAIPNNPFQTEAPSWQMAFDSMSTNPTSFVSFNNVYGATHAPFHLGLTKKIFMSANDMNLNPPTYGQTAKRIRLGMVWQPAGGVQNLIVKVSSCRKVDVDSSANGPAVQDAYSGIMILKTNQVASAQLIVEANLGLVAGGVPLPTSAGGGVVLAFGTDDGSGNFAELTVGQGSAQPILCNMTSPGEPYFPGTNPSSSHENDWEDDSANSPSITQPNYFFEDYTNTTALGVFPYAEQYSGDMGSAAGGGIYQPCVSLFVDTNAKKISGTLTLASLVGPTKPKVADFEIYDPATSTVIDTVSAPISPTGAYSINDPRPTTGGSYRVRAKVTHWLKAGADVNTTGGNGVANITLPNGDVDRNNTVDLTDYTYLVTNFNMLSSSPDWLVADEFGISPSDSDLNGDGAIDLTDYTILVTNFNGIGE
ncbi:MAG: hypothetical protein K8R88_14460 [Armatimonadetes bacterium]|nr:hypothetical protein [Armatimonadota bacterium]